MRAALMRQSGYERHPAVPDKWEVSDTRLFLKSLDVEAPATRRLLHHSTVISIQGESYQLKDKRRAGLLKAPAALQVVTAPAE